MVLGQGKMDLDRKVVCSSPSAGSEREDLDECEEAYRFLDNFDTSMIDRLYETSLLGPEWTELDWRRFEFEPGVPVTFESLAEFVQWGPRVAELAAQFAEVLEPPVPHALPPAEVCALFAGPLLPRGAIGLLRHSAEVAAYHHHFVQCYLRVFFFESMDELRDWHRHHKQPTLADLLEDMQL